MLQGSNNNNQNYIKLSTIYTFQFVTFSPTNYLNNRWLLVTWKNRFRNTRFPNRIYFYISLSDILIFLQCTTNSFQNPSIKIHQSQSIYRFPIYPPPSRPSLLFTTRLDRNPNHRPRPISRWIIHDGIESIAFPPRQTPIILLKDLLPRNAGSFFVPLPTSTLLPIFHPSRRCVSSYVFVRGRTNAAARKGGSRSTSSSLCGAARRGVVDCLSRFMFTRRDPADPDNKLPRSGCIKGRKGETGEATVRRVEWEKRQRGEPEQTWRDTLFPVKETQDYAGTFYKRGDAFVMRLFLFLSFSNCRRLLIIKIRIFIVLFFFLGKINFDGIYL